MALALMVCVYTSYSRAALAASFVVATLAVLAFLRGKARAALATAFVVTALAIASTPNWRGWAQHAARNLSSDRAQSMQIGLGLARANPLFGVGFGNHYEAAMAVKTEPPVFDLIAHNSHNFWLTTWVETGLVGLALMAWWVVALGLALWRRAREGSWAAAGAFLSFVAFQLVGVVHHVPTHSSVALAFAFVWGLGLADRRPPPHGLPA
jgi:O-antigen ligase